jgi:hypothetical protein
MPCYFGYLDWQCDKRAPGLAGNGAEEPIAICLTTATKCYRPFLALRRFAADAMIRRLSEAEQTLSQAIRAGVFMSSRPNTGEP